MNRIKLAHPVGHKLKFNGKPLSVERPLYDIWGGNFEYFSYAGWTPYYWIDEVNTTYGYNIETDVESEWAPDPGVKTYGYLNIYQKVSIPTSRLNDKFVILDFPFIPYRDSRSFDIMRKNIDYSNLKIGLIRECENNQGQDPSSNYQNEFSFNISSIPTGVIQKSTGHYGAGSWSHTLTIPNISYTDTFTKTEGQGHPDYIIRLLCDLITKKTYLKVATNFPSRIVLSDYIDTGFNMIYGTKYPGSYNYIINVFADGFGIKAPDGYPLEYLIAGYHVGGGKPITIKS